MYHNPGGHNQGGHPDEGWFNKDPRALREEMQQCGSGERLKQQAEVCGLLWAA